MVAILVRILMLVACVPLLQPTGLCACKSAASGRASLHADLADSTLCPATAQKPGCCSHRYADAEGHGPVAPARPAPCPTTGDDHLPGCPASVGVDRFKWVEPVQPLNNTPPLIEATVFVSLEVVAHVGHLIPLSFAWPSSPPLYLSHCSLVI